VLTGRVPTKRIRRGAFASVAELQGAIHDYLAHHNANPKPFVVRDKQGETQATIRMRRFAGVG
jgi:hypothetical protein